MSFSSSDAASWRLEKPGRREALTARTSTRRWTFASASASSTAGCGVCSYPMVKSGVFAASTFQPFDQRHGGRRGAHFPFVNKIHEHLTRLRLGFLRLLGTWQIVGFPSAGPEAGTLRPCIQCVGLVAALQRVATLLQTRIDEVARDIRDSRVG